MLDTIITAILSSSIISGLLIWMTKSWIAERLKNSIKHEYDQKLESHKAQLKYEADTEIEKIKAELQIEAHRNSVNYSTLHSKRAEYITQLYSRLVNLYEGIIGLSYELGAREVRADHYARYDAIKSQPWEIKEGIQTLSIEEETKAKNLHETYKEFMKFYNEKKIYFSEEVCALIEQFANLAGFMGTMYQNVALRDDDNQPYFNPIVLETWFKAGERIPKLLATMEKEFRVMLGVTNEQA